MHEQGLLSNPRFWVAVAFVVFFLAFGRKLWSALAAILDKRAEDVRAELAEARQLRAEAESMLTEARARRAEAMAEANAMLEGARAEAERLAREAAAEAQSSAERRKRMALDRIAAAEKEAVSEVRTAAADIATRAAEQIVRETLSPEDDGALVSQAIAGLPAALGGRRAA